MRPWQRMMQPTRLRIVRLHGFANSTKLGTRFHLSWQWSQSFSSPLAAPMHSQDVISPSLTISPVLPQEPRLFGATIQLRTGRDSSVSDALVLVLRAEVAAQGVTAQSNTGGHLL